MSVTKTAIAEYPVEISSVILFVTLPLIWALEANHLEASDKKPEEYYYQEFSEQCHELTCNTHKLMTEYGHELVGTEITTVTGGNEQILIRKYRVTGLSKDEYDFTYFEDFCKSLDCTTHMYATESGWILDSIQERYVEDLRVTRRKYRRKKNYHESLKSGTALESSVNYVKELEAERDALIHHNKSMETAMEVMKEHIVETEKEEEVKEVTEEVVTPVEEPEKNSRCTLFG